MLQLTATVHAQLIGHAYDGLPLEACGLLGGRQGSTSTAMCFYPSVNVAASSRVYTVDPRTHLLAERDAERRGLEIVGVVHSHTHTPPYPSATDVAQAPDPSWHYVIVSLAAEAPEVRSYRIIEGKIAEEPIVVAAG